MSPETRTKLAESLTREFISLWYVCDPAKALAICPDAMVRAKFAAMAEAAIEGVENAAIETFAPVEDSGGKDTRYGEHDREDLFGTKP